MIDMGEPETGPEQTQERQATGMCGSTGEPDGNREEWDVKRVRCEVVLRSDRTADTVDTNACAQSVPDTAQSEEQVDRRESSRAADVLGGIYQELEGIIHSFSSESRYAFKSVMKELNAYILRRGYDATHSMTVMDRILDILCSSNGTGYFFFYSEDIYTFLMAMLRKETSLSSQLKLSAFSGLRRLFDSQRLFCDIITAYSAIDTFCLDGSSFRNFILRQLVKEIMGSGTRESANVKAVGMDVGETENGNNTDVGGIRSHKCVEKRDSADGGRVDGVVSSLLSLVSYLDVTPGFLEYITRHLEDDLNCRVFAMGYVFKWLKSVKIDLLRVTASSIPKDIESKAITRIFLAYPGMLSGYLKRAKLARHGNKKGDGKDHKKGSDNKTGCGNSSNMHNSATTEQDVLMSMFGAADPEQIFASVYRRLFFYVLAQNRRALGSCKIIRVFKKAEVRRIYKRTRESPGVFINLFSQLDRKYLIREVESTLNPSIFRLIGAESVPSGMLYPYYRTYFKILEKNRLDDLTVKITDLNVFSQAFCDQIDLFFISYLRLSVLGCEEELFVIREKAVSRRQFLVSEMLRRYSGCFREALVDSVAIASAIVDSPGAMLEEANAPFYNNVIQVLTNVPISAALASRLSGMLVKAFRHPWYTHSIGGFLYRLYGERAWNIKEATMSLGAMAALNHPGFKEALRKAVDLALAREEGGAVQGVSVGGSAGNGSVVDDKENSDTSNAQNMRSAEAVRGGADTTGTNSTGDWSVIGAALLSYGVYDLPFVKEYQWVLSWVIRGGGDNSDDIPDDTKQNKNKLATTNSHNITASLLRVLGSSSAALFGFVSEHISRFQQLAECAEYSTDIMRIFINSLRAKEVLPCMVVAHLLCACDSDYLYRNHMESILNCLPNALSLLTGRIRSEIDSQSIEGEISLSAQTSADRNDQCKMLPNDILGSIIDKRDRVPFLFILSGYVPVKRIISALPVSCDILSAFVIVRQMRRMSDRDKGAFLGYLETAVQEEAAMELVHKSREFYRHISGGIVPVEYMLE